MNTFAGGVCVVNMLSDEGVKPPLRVLVGFDEVRQREESHSLIDLFEPQHEEEVDFEHSQRRGIQPLTHSAEVPATRKGEGKKERKKVSQ